MTIPIGLHEIPIDDILENAYDKLEEAYIMGEDKNAISRFSFPIVSEMASPGSGKTHSIEVLAADQKILQSWWDKKQSSRSRSPNNVVKNAQLPQDFYEKMKNALRIVVTYNSFSDFDGLFDEEELAEIGMCCRILYRFVLMVIYFFKSHLMKNNTVAMLCIQDLLINRTGQHFSISFCRFSKNEMLP